MDTADDRRALGYCAGIFEGEGWSGILTIKSAPRPYTVARINVGMDDPEPVVYLHATLGGNFTIIREKRRQRPERYVWSVAARQAFRVAGILLPHCQSKRKKAQLQSVLDHYTPEKVAARNASRIAKIKAHYHKAA